MVRPLFYRWILVNLYKETVAASTVLGIDLGKRWFHVVGRNHAGQITVRTKFNRAQLIQFIVNHSQCLIGMETCFGSQHFARKFQAMGHEVKLLPAQFVRPFVKSQKNDFNDALAISEAVVMRTMRFVPVRSEEQMDVQALHPRRSPRHVCTTDTAGCTFLLRREGHKDN